ncbi:prenyltransferase and squalene oxidase repeat protein [bacterium BMS3Abin12]|nr:prenyltransferase and squalene oxidase repeat protein [bacterium BMS3Abin12]HDO34337.1 hypothetical protein [Chromatiales bacterium]
MRRSNAGTRAMHIDIQACMRYIASRQDPDGGFCFYRDFGVDESNAPDTLAAVAGLDLLEEPVPRRPDVVAWLRGQQRDKGDFATLTIAWACVKALRLLGTEPEHDVRPYVLGWAQRLLRPGKAYGAGTLRALVRVTDLADILGIVPEREVSEAGLRLLKELQGPEGGYGVPGANLVDTWHALQVAGRLDSDLKTEALDYARCCEHPAYGFNIAPRAVTTAVEVQVAGLEILARCGASPRYAGATRRFVAACQTPHGGFARVPGALTRLEDTWLGLRALDCLSRLAGG